MEYQPRGEKKISVTLKEFLNNRRNFKFDEHGFAEISKEYSKKTCAHQEMMYRFEENSLVYCATELGQPFLFWNNEMLDCGGVLDYNPIDQVGNFLFETSTGILKIQNVHSYNIFFRISKYDKILPFTSTILPTLDDMDDIFVSAIVKENETFRLKIFHNTTLIYEHHKVWPEEYIEYNENCRYSMRFAYVRFSEKKENVFSNYIFDLRNERCYEMDNSSDFPSWYIDYNEHRADWARHQDSLTRGDEFSVILHLDNSKTAQIVAEYVKDADRYRVLDNVFSDDATVNLEVMYKNQPEKIRFLYYCASKNADMYGHGIMGIPMGKLEIGTLNYEYEYKRLLNHKEDVDVKYYKLLVSELYKKCHEKQEINMLPSKVLNSCLSSYEMIVCMYQYLREYCNCQNELPAVWLSAVQPIKSFFDKEAKEYDDIYNKLAKENKLKTRWKNEYSLYQMVVKEYPDAIYQFHSEWLGKQSLDIFIPSVNVGIEYQGLQHYKAIPFFGGETALKYRENLDAKKKELCKAKGVKVVEWRYDEPITNMYMKNKF